MSRQPPSPSSPVRSPRWRRALPWLVVAGLGGALALGGVLVWADYRRGLPADAAATYVGRQTCVECHQTEYHDWLGSHHDRAMDHATDATVLGDFNDAEITHHGLTSRFFRRDGKFWTHTEGPDGQFADFEIKYVLGFTPLQQYMVEFDRPANMPAHEIARLQVLRLCWDTEKKSWFYLPPPDVKERLAPDDDLHWTGVTQRWNTTCAECHSTNLRKNHDLKTGVYHTTFSEIDVSCEACHGPASLHVELARRWSLFWDRQRGFGLPKLKVESNQPQIHTCAPCHVRQRRVARANHQPGENLYDYLTNDCLREDLYFADGQIRDEVYEFGSFTQSKMFHKGVRCTDCHQPHSGKLLHQGNKLCTSCHAHPPYKYDTPAHHRHASDSKGALCVECHMPSTIYMEVDARRDHGLRVPRPDLSARLGVPNACTGCHLEVDQPPSLRRLPERAPGEPPRELRQYLDWLQAAEAGDAAVAAELKRLDARMDEAARRWWPRDEARPPHFAEALHKAYANDPEAAEALSRWLRDPQTPAIVRASMATHLAPRARPEDVEALRAALRDADPQVRAAAAGAYDLLLPTWDGDELDAGGPPPAAREGFMRQALPLARDLAAALDDPLRMPRIEAARALTRLPRWAVGEALSTDERVRWREALREYEAALDIHGDRAGALTERGYLYERLGDPARAEAAYRDATRVEPGPTGPRSNLAELLTRRADSAERDAARARAEGAATRAADHAARAEGWRAEARALRAEEITRLARDARLLPNQPTLHYRLGLALYRQGREEEAEAPLRRAAELAPREPQYALFLALLYQKQGRLAEALGQAERAAGLAPDRPDLRALLEELRASPEEPRRSAPR